ncbi:MAG TPA: nitroreductase/quinone reductase family protein [Solirubrobacteraceae bacterium]|nr:nitroreductase/quinone reductase family protein [Solirubrobacteraceae bacterium]
MIARLLHLTARTGPPARLLSRAHARLYAATRGRALGRWFGGAPVIVLETTGRRTGRRRATTVICVRDGGRYLVCAANAGADPMPAWCLNLRASGSGTVVDGGRRVRVRPRELRGDEREDAWRRFAGRYPALDDYARYTQRRFPLVWLEPE